MRPLLLALLVVGTCSSCKTSSNPEPTPSPSPSVAPSTAESVATPAAKVYDLSTPQAQAAAVKEAAGITAVGDCVHAVPEFPDVVLVGYQGHNGCVLRGYFAGGVYVEERENARPAFGAAWSDPAKRDALARTWLDKAMRIQLQSKDGGAAVPAAVAADGSLILEGYDPLPHGAGFYNRVRVTVAADGQITVEALERGLEAPQLR